MIDAAALARWLGATEVVVEGRPSGGGWSNETVFVRADDRSLVVRLTPSGPSMFPRYDLGHQVRNLELAARNGLPVPEVVGYEAGAAVLGRPFFVMVRLPGRVPSDDQPTFAQAGFLFEASPAQQRRFCEDAVDRIAAVHLVPPPPDAPVGPALADHLAWGRELCRWSGLDQEVVVATEEALQSALPAPSGPAGLLWGDARPANMVVDDRFAVVGLLDWELAGSGPGELDLAWFWEMNRMRAEGSGLPRLAGFLDEGATWARWSAIVGRPPADLEWHRRYAAYRVAILMHLYLRGMVQRGRLPADHRLFVDNVALRRLTELAGLAA